MPHNRLFGARPNAIVRIRATPGRYNETACWGGADQAVKRSRHSALERVLPLGLAVALALGLTVTLVAQSASLAAGSAKTWVGRESQIEAYLKTAEVARVEEVGEGVTRPSRAFLKSADPVDSFAWKVLPPGRRSGHWESYRSEIAAYELDKLLDMKMVPPAVERTVDGKVGAAIMWIGSIKSVKQTGGNVPSGPAWGGAVRRMQMFDNLIANPDRNSGNILIGAPGELILIDHSRAFLTDKSLRHKFERVDADLWERMKALTGEDLHRALGPWLEDDAIGAIIERRNRMASEVDKLVSKNGAAAVIIP